MKKAIKEQTRDACPEEYMEDNKKTAQLLRKTMGLDTPATPEQLDARKELLHRGYEYS